MPAPDLLTAELTLTGRITTASNATFLGSIVDTTVVYKPIAGEKPLWDFPDGFLAHREVAAYLVSEVLGWNVVPRTWLRDGPLGKGMVQLGRRLTPTGTQWILLGRTPYRNLGGSKSLKARMSTGGWSASSTRTPRRSDAWRSSTRSSTTPTAKAITSWPWQTATATVWTMGSPFTVTTS